MNGDYEFVPSNDEIVADFSHCGNPVPISGYVPDVKLFEWLYEHCANGYSSDHDLDNFACPMTMFFETAGDAMLFKFWIQENEQELQAR